MYIYIFFFFSLGNFKLDPHICNHLAMLISNMKSDDQLSKSRFLLREFVYDVPLVCLVVEVVVMGFTLTDDPCKHSDSSFFLAGDDAQPKVCAAGMARTLGSDA